MGGYKSADAARELIRRRNFDSNDHDLQDRYTKRFSHARKSYPNVSNGNSKITQNGLEFLILYWKGVDEGTLPLKLSRDDVREAVKTPQKSVEEFSKKYSEVYSVQDAAAILGVTRTSISHWLTQGLIDYHEFGSDRYPLKKTIDAMLPYKDGNPANFQKYFQDIGLKPKPKPRKAKPKKSKKSRKKKPTVQKPKRFSYKGHMDQTYSDFWEGRTKKFKNEILKEIREEVKGTGYSPIESGWIYEDDKKLIKAINAKFSKIRKREDDLAALIEETVVEKPIEPIKIKVKSAFAENHSYIFEGKSQRAKTRILKDLEARVRSRYTPPNIKPRNYLWFYEDNFEAQGIVDSVAEEYVREETARLEQQKKNAEEAAARKKALQEAAKREKEKRRAREKERENARKELEKTKLAKQKSEAKKISSIVANPSTYIEIAVSIFEVLGKIKDKEKLDRTDKKVANGLLDYITDLSGKKVKKKNPYYHEKATKDISVRLAGQSNWMVHARVSDAIEGKELNAASIDIITKVWGNFRVDMIGYRHKGPGLDLDDDLLNILDKEMSELEE